MIKACKLYEVPNDIRGTIQVFKTLGFNTLMLGKKCLKSPLFCEEIHKSGLKWSLIESVFLIDEDSDAQCFAQDKHGRAAINDWVRFACPNNTQWLESFFTRLYEHACLKPDGISLDFLRFFQFWEVLPENAKNDDLIQTCFCPACRESLRSFISKKGIKDLNDSALAKWRCSVITSVAEKAATIIRSVSPEIRIGLHIVPWCISDYGHAQALVLGQDLAALAKIGDYFTPMTYHHMLGRSPEVIEKIVADHFQCSGGKIPIIPSVQVRPYYRKEELDSDEFIASIRSALKTPSSGIAFFSGEDLLKDKEKMKIVEKELGEHV